jgi:hypothetical protein
MTILLLAEANLSRGHIDKPAFGDGDLVDVPTEIVAHLLRAA